MRHGFAQLDHIRLHFVDCGKSDELVILLHGFPECWYSWRHQLAVLGERYHVVAPDMRGYNLSDKPRGKENYDMSLLIEDVRAVIKHLGRDRAVIVGHDWGGRVAWGFAM